MLEGLKNAARRLLLSQGSSGQGQFRSQEELDAASRREARKKEVRRLVDDPKALAERKARHGRFDSLVYKAEWLAKRKR